MGIEQVFSDDNHQILKAELPAGGIMPQHHATSDAFVIIVKGKAELIFDDRKSVLASGSTFLIPGGRSHRLEVNEDFQAYIILAPHAGIEMEERKERMAVPEVA